MANLATTYQHIANILSFETSNSKLEKTISDATFNWDTIVIEGSKQLVLPAIYCRLKTRQLLHLLPKDLTNYLEQITNINRARNIRILNQVHNISQILNQHNIDHVFLKGAALLASGCYKDNGERMVGDIDILVEKSEIFNAFEILKNSGYNKTFGFAYEKKDFRHLDRLISENELAAIELHTELLNKTHWPLLNMPTILNSKIRRNTIAISNKHYLSQHLILAWQLNDKGHYYNIISLKSIYDLIAIEVHKEQNLIYTLLNSKYGQSYLELAKCYFPEFSSIPTNNYMKYRIFLHKIKMSFKPLRIIINCIKQATIFISSRLYLVYTNRSYTKHIIKEKILNKTNLFNSY
ncbi:nucleotidyltransferase family protein [Winogradskyella helgolandensis]|uniref:nucleotidyltransferase family protein n=1 Tax=Winogradskyella helgolandensis TaxID=2697010 RepID=UPI0015BF01EF|nr:nucleotidyltransferase family protein [Winogradskyella helgolandensis]